MPLSQSIGGIIILTVISLYVYTSSKIFTIFFQDNELNKDINSIILFSLVVSSIGIITSKYNLLNENYLLLLFILVLFVWIKLYFKTFIKLGKIYLKKGNFDTEGIELFIIISLQKETLKKPCQIINTYKNLTLNKCFLDDDFIKLISMIMLLSSILTLFFPIKEIYNFMIDESRYPTIVSFLNEYISGIPMVGVFVIGSISSLFIIKYKFFLLELENISFKNDEIIKEKFNVNCEESI